MMIVFSTTAAFVTDFPHYVDDLGTIERLEEAEFVAHPDWNNFLRALTEYELREYAHVIKGSPRFGVLVNRTSCGGVCRNFGLIEHSESDSEPVPAESRFGQDS
jgi:hypothetical protein